MDNSITITCDACGKDFDLTIRNRKSYDLLFRFLECPHCKSIFLIDMTDAEFRKLVKKNKMNNNQRIKLQQILQERYFPRFKELFPTAYKKQTEMEKNI